MKRLVALLAAAMLAGCGQGQAREPALQRLDALHGEMAQTTRLSGSLVTVKARLDTDVALGRALAVRRDAAGLQRAAGALVLSTSRLARDLSALAGPGWTVPQLRYLRALVRTADMEQREGRALGAEAELIWWDPFLDGSTTGPRVGRLDLAARWDAWQALRDVLGARLWRQRHLSAFRYVPEPAAEAQPAPGDFLPNFN